MYSRAGNHLTQVANGATTNYVYDNANRLTSVNGQAYVWDNNGNLLSDGNAKKSASESIPILEKYFRMH